MKRMSATVPLIFLAVLLLPASAAGQAYFLGISASSARPLDPPYARTYLKPSFGPGFHLLMRLSDRVGCNFDFCFYRFGLESRRFVEDKGGNASSAVGSLNLDVVSMSLVGSANSMENPVSVYATGGMGYYRLNPRNTWLVSRWTDDEGQAQMDSSLINLGGMRNRFALNAGLGANFRLFKRVSFFMEYRYHWIFLRTHRHPMTGESIREAMILSATLAGIRMLY
ncbi:outer membrane beta-barrel protein [bacterium]|nr:outer membrane beta-barrel protein [bacterium]